MGKYPKEKLKKIFETSVVLHFNDEKPWEYSDLKFQDEWIKYYNLSMYTDVKLKRGTIIKRLKKVFNRGGVSGVVEFYIIRRLRKLYYFIRGMEFRKKKCPKDTWG